mmetsp:Transcript_5910/g.15472  ORF Transcript_5910/g.15472 Transcript_5910/m.15472 type:complete len:133 (+) Transcript_5910:71-469(+)
MRAFFIASLIVACAHAFTPLQAAGRVSKTLVRASSSSAFAVSPISARPASVSQSAHMSLFGLGWPELLVIGGAALIFFGPEKLTDIAKEAGKSASALKDASSAFQEGMNEAEKGDKDLASANPKKEITDKKD